MAKLTACVFCSMVQQKTTAPPQKGTQNRESKVKKTDFRRSRSRLISQCTMTGFIQAIPLALSAPDQTPPPFLPPSLPPSLPDSLPPSPDYKASQRTVQTSPKQSSVTVLVIPAIVHAASSAAATSRPPSTVNVKGTTADRASPHPSPTSSSTAAPARSASSSLVGSILPAVGREEGEINERMARNEWWLIFVSRRRYHYLGWWRGGRCDATNT